MCTVQAAPGSPSTTPCPRCWSACSTPSPAGSWPSWCSGRGNQSQLAVRSRDTCSPPIGQPPLLLLTSSAQLATFALVWYTVFYTRLGALPRQKYVLPALLLAQDLQRLCMN